MNFQVLAFLLVASSAASAQVYKCPNQSTGKITYSDSPCVEGKMIERQRTQAEVLQDQQRAAAAQHQYTNAQAREAGRQQQARQPAPTGYQQPIAADSRNSAECQRAQRDLETTASSITGTDEVRARNITAANRKVDMACLGAARAGSIRAAEAGAPKPEITNHNYGNNDPAKDYSPKWCQGGYCW